MAAYRKYPIELRERATRLKVEARKDSSTRPGACRRIGEQLRIKTETLRSWSTRPRSTAACVVGRQAIPRRG
ncbi:MAG: hypothetical protein ABI112_02285 [Terracoccus sp.]